MTEREAFTRFLSPLRRAILGLVVKAVVLAVKDSTDLQVLQVSLGNGEKQEDVERVQNFGFTSVPKKGAQAVVIFVGGNRDNPLCIAVDDGRVRVKLLPGEAAMYSDGDAVVKATASGEVELGDGGTFLPTEGVINGEAIDSFTGLTQFALANASTKVFARSS